MAKTSERDDIRRHQVAHKVESWALAHHPTIPGLCVSGDERGVAMAVGLVGWWAGGWLGRSDGKSGDSMIQRISQGKKLGI